jgi:hypothetical protein
MGLVLICGLFWRFHAAFKAQHRLGRISHDLAPKNGNRRTAPSILAQNQSMVRNPG